MSEHISRFIVASAMLVCIPAIGLSLCPSGQAAANTDFLRGSGKDLEMRIAGTLVDRDGNPLEDCTISAQLTEESPLDVRVDGNRFEIWVPVNKVDWFRMQLIANDSRQQLFARHSFALDELREAAVNGITLKLMPPERWVTVNLEYQDKPLANASVRASADGKFYDAQTNAEGVARLPIPAGERIYQIGAYAEPGLTGGFTTDRRPQRDPTLDEYDIQMYKCRTVTVKTIDVEKREPAPGVEVEIHIATPKPFYSYIGSHSKFTYVRTNEIGEFEFKWLPDWEEYYFDVRVKNKWYFEAEEPKVSEDELIISVKKSLIRERKTVTGKVNGEGSNVAGLCIEMLTFQAEEEEMNERLYAFSDANGTFQFDVLPDTTYCVWISDSKLVCQPIDLIPYEQKTKKINQPIVDVFEGFPVEILVTSGPYKKPLPNQSVHLRSIHQFTYEEYDEKKPAAAGRQWYVRSDENGIARAYACSGDLQISMNDHLWERQTHKISVQKNGTTKFDLHCQTPKHGR
jgi:hypothetical protein